MDVITDLTTRRPTPAVLTIGNFDGVHRGHQQLLGLVCDRAQTLGVSGVVMTFEPHTRAVVRPDAPLFLLTQLPEKLAQFARLDWHYCAALLLAHLTIQHALHPQQKL